MADALNLLFKITADSSKAQSEIKALQSTVSKEISQIKKVVDDGGSAFGSFGSIVKTAGIGIAAVGTVAVAAAGSLFALVKSASDAGSAIYDASQKTGFTAESLSALKNAAEASGGSFETISGALGIFEKNMTAAEQGNKKMSATFKALNIDTKDNEKALRDAFAILSRMPDGAEKTAAAMQLFGRSGKDVLGVIQETNGNLDVAIAKYRELGLIISTEDAAAADKFGDQLTLMQQQFAGLAREIGVVLMPAISELLTYASDWVRNNKEEIKGFLIGTGQFIREWIVTPLREGIQALKETYDWLAMLPRMLDMDMDYMHKALKAVERSQNNKAFADIGGVVNAPGVSMMGTNAFLLGSAVRSQSATTPHLPSLGGGGGGGGGKTHDDKGRAAIEAIEKENEAIVESARSTREKLREIYEQGNQDREEYFKEAQTALMRKYTEELRNLGREEDVATSRIKKQEELDAKLQEIDNKRQKLTDTYEKEKRKLATEANETAIDERVSYLKRLDEKTRFYEDVQLKRAEEVAGRSLAQQAEYEKLRYDQQVLQLNRREEILTEELKKYGEFSQQYLALLNELELADAEALAAKEAYARRMNEITFQIGQADREKAASDVFKSAGGSTESPQGTALGAAILKDAGLKDAPVMFDGLKAALSDLKAIGLDAFHSMGQAFGSLVGQWASGANIGKNAFRTIVSSAIAGVAAMAATQAIYELALGVAALTPWGFALYGSPVQHFHAAALLGSIAAISAVAGRALAPSAAGGAVAGTALKIASGGGSSSSNPQPIDVGRTGGGRLANVVEKLAATVDRLTAASPGQVLIAGASQAPHAITNTIRDDFRQKGITRQIVVDQRA